MCLNTPIQVGRFVVKGHWSASEVYSLKVRIAWDNIKEVGEANPEDVLENVVFEFRFFLGRQFIFHAVVERMDFKTGQLDPQDSPKRKALGLGELLSGPSGILAAQLAFASMSNHRQTYIAKDPSR